MKRTYKPIRDYAAIGNLHNVALIGVDGSIDWCCFPDMDDQAVFAALLDINKGGYFSVTPIGFEKGEQKYISSTNVLKTRYKNGKVDVTVIDFMPLEGDITKERKQRAKPEIQRVIKCEGGECEVEIVWAPRFDYARASMKIEKKENGWIAYGNNYRMSLCGIDNGELVDKEGPVVVSKFHLKKGEKRVLVTRWESDNIGYSIDKVEKELNDTLKSWENWVDDGDSRNGSDWAGEYKSLVIRSLLVLKMLDYAPTGSIAAAPTTSLPETIGGVRNWDYRFTWIRDAALAAQALIALGHEVEADEFLTWLEELAAKKFTEKLSLQIMYSLDGAEDIPEEELSHLEGYQKSAPVRIGNEAAEQFQLETYGEIFLIGHELLRRGIKLKPEVMKFLSKVADHVCDVWEKPDFGIWEIRGEARHFTYSKILAWVALDRAVNFYDNFNLDGDKEKWCKERDKIHDWVIKHGFNKKLNSFVQSKDSEDADAALLRIPIIEFLPANDPMVQGTIDFTMKVLMENDLVYRYKNDDGLPGKEGAFGLTTFWLVDVLALSGRTDEAKRIFNKLAAQTNHVGLFAEQIDPETNEFLGNFPQAFTHIGLIISLLYLAYADGHKIPVKELVGTPEHRNSFGRKD
jgi:GH15 family glucan-1,4-alpha-glucosidase